MPPVVFGTPVVGTPPTVELLGFADGNPGVVRLGALPPSEVDGTPVVEPGVPIVASDPTLPVDDDTLPVDDVPPRPGVSCVSVGLRSVGTLGFGALVAGRTRTRSPSGIPCRRAWLLC